MKRLLFLSVLMLLIGAQSGFAESTEAQFPGMSPTRPAPLFRMLLFNSRHWICPRRQIRWVISPFLAVPPGAYILQVTCTGFTAVTKDITINAGQTLRIDFSLEVAAGNEQVWSLPEPDRTSCRRSTRRSIRRILCR